MLKNVRQVETNQFDKLIYDGTPTQGIADGIIEIGDYSIPQSIASPADHLFALHIVLQLEGSVDKWFAPAYLRIQTDDTNPATLSHLAALLGRVDIDQDCKDAYVVQHHLTIDDADVSGFAKAGSFKVDRGSGPAVITGEVSALQAILDGAALNSPGRANAFMAVIYSAVQDADEIAYLTANEDSIVGNGLYIANHGTMTNAIQINSAGGSLGIGIDMLGTLTTGIDLSGATLTQDLILQGGHTLVDDTNSITIADMTFGTSALTPNAANRGKFYFVEGSSGNSDVLYCIMKDWLDSYNAVEIASGG